MLAPPAGSHPLPGWAEGHCRYPEDRVPPRTSSKLRQRTRRACVPTCPEASVPASRLGATPGPPRVPTAPVPASRLGAATCPRGSGSRLGAAPRPPRAPAAPASASRLRAAPGPSHELQHPPSGSGQLRRCHVSRGRALQATSN
jgi:hypothetical protein